MIRGVSVLDGARFTCQGSGGCCGGYVYGPVEDAVVQAVSAHRFRQNAERIHTTDGPFETAEVDGEPARVLRRIDGQCVFLSPTHRCVIHAELGAQHKPAICRAFPLNIAVAPDGVAYVSLNMECAGFARGMHGEPLEDTLEDTLPVLLSLPIQHVPQSVTWSQERRLDYEEAADIEMDWLEMLEAPNCAPSALVAQLCASWAIADGQPKPPETTADHHPWLAGAEAPANALITVFAAAFTTEATAERAAANFIDALLNDRAAAAAQAWLSGDRPTLGTAPGDPADALLRTHLQNAVFGKALHRAPSIGAGLGLEAAKLALTALLAEQLAHPTPPTPEHVNEALRTLNRCQRPSGLEALGPIAVAEAEAIARAHVR